LRRPRPVAPDRRGQGCGCGGGRSAGRIEAAELMLRHNTAKIVLKSAGEGELRRAAGQLVRRLLDDLGTLVKPGATTAQLNDRAATLIREAGATPLFLGVRNPEAKFPFPGAICASVNEEIVHGIPNDRPLKNGDIVS